MSDQLSQWIDWPHAVALSSALDGRPPTALLDQRILRDADDGECARARASLVNAIVGDRAFAAPMHGASAAAQAHADERLSYPFYRHRYLALQQTMEAGAGRLRERLRALLSCGTEGMARLAAVDAVMERSLSRRERALLAVTPTLLGEHFERLRQDAQRAALDAQAADEAALEQVALEQAALEQAALDQSASDQSASDQVASDQAALHQAASNQAASDQAVPEHTGLEQAAPDNAASNETASNKRASRKRASHKAASSQAEPNNAAPNQIAVDPATTDAPATAISDAWLEAFRRDMQNVLLAELDLRLQPAHGLLAALRTSPHG